MLSALAAVLIIEALSLLMLFLNFQIFKSQTEKYRLLLSSMGGLDTWGKPGRILLPLYIVLVLGTTVVTTSIFIFQPHLL